MNKITGRILAVDPGDKRIGLALSDTTAILASPLKVLKHVSRSIDAASIAQIARENEVVLIIVGQPLDSEGEVGPAARKSVRLVEAVQLQTEIPIELWDESGSTQAARETRIRMGAQRKQRSGHLDDLAAVIILQSYLDAQSITQFPNSPDS